MRIFLTLWIIFSVHWATDFVREHFLVLSIVDRHSFALDGFEDMHPDIFVHTDGHSYHGANPGVSMLGAVPYFVLSPVVNRIVARDLASRPTVEAAPPQYNDPREARRRFYQQARERGLDVRFGLVGLITLVFAMAPLSALGGVVFFKVLEGTGLTRTLALGGTALYALGTPIFFRSAYLNQNIAVGIVGFIALALLWNPGKWSAWSRRTRLIVAGICGGFALLCDYSGGLTLAAMGGYALWTLTDEEPFPVAVRQSLWYVVGAFGPIMLLWYYQWAAFGFPFYPPQHYMPPVEWSDLGYQGVTGPQADLFALLMADPRYGLLVTTPIALLALAAPFVAWRSDTFVPRREILVALGLTAAYVAFFSMVQYTRLQYITGIRYLLPVVPLVALASMVVLMRIPRVLAYGVAFVSFVINWGLAMGRFQEQEGSILATLVRVFVGGLQLPALGTLQRMSAQYLPSGAVVSASAVYLLVAVVLWLIWTVERPWRPFAADIDEAPAPLA
jgi:hypothetical protein